MVDFGESDKMIKISGKVDKSNIYNGFCSLVGWVFTIGLRDLGSILGHVIPKTLKMVLDTSLLNTQ